MSAAVTSEVRAIEYDELPRELRELAEEAFLRHAPRARRIQLLAEIYRRQPACLIAALDLALCLQEAGEWDAAAEIYERAARWHPQDVRTLAGLAWLRCERGDIAGGELLARQALERGSEWTCTYEALARGSEARGDLAGAAEFCLKAYEAAPQNCAILEHHCRLAGRPFLSPLDDPPDPPVLSRLTRHRLYSYIDRTRRGVCDHRLTAVKAFCGENGLDPVEVYQFLMVYGGFCDCEVGVNVIELESDFQAVLSAGWMDAPGRLPSAIRTAADGPVLDRAARERVRCGEPCPIAVAREGRSRWRVPPQVQDPAILVDALEALDGEREAGVLVLCAIERDEAQIWGRSGGRWWEAAPGDALPLGGQDAAAVRELLAALGREVARLRD